MSFLLDTDICSAYLRHNNAITARFIQHRGRIHISLVTAGELLAWAKRVNSPASRMMNVRKLIGFVNVIAVDGPIIERWSTIRAFQLDYGAQSPKMDLLIAATALEHNLTLVTHNTKDFVNIPGLQLDDWLVP